MSAKKKVAPFGSWVSPITADRLGGAALRLSSVAFDGDDRYWLEGRAAEGGRTALVRRGSEAAPIDVTPAPFNVRSRVHEYGGLPYVVADGEIWFVNFRDQQIYRTTALGTEPMQLTHAPEYRFADLILDRARQRLIAIAERHTGEGGEPENLLVSIGIDDGALRTLAAGDDFYAHPVMRPDGSELAWLSWSHPNMPWDETKLWVAPVATTGELATPRMAGGGNQVAVFQPEYSPNGRLFFVSDESGWWNLYCLEDNNPRPIAPMPHDFGRALWQFGMRTYGFISESRLLASYIEHGAWSLTEIDLANGKHRSVDSPFTDFDGIRIRGERLLSVAGNASEPSQVAEIDLSTGNLTTHQIATNASFAAGYLSTPEAVSFQTSDDQQAHGFFYPPYNQDYSGPDAEKPPLLVVGHGGPTSATSTSLNLSLQFWTSRGFGVLDVNYRGSTGYGREYRNRLRGQWGIYDVADCVHGALFLSDRGAADRDRLAIRGGSAGGYTALAALTFHDVFAAGASYYGISELEVLAKETHKFESRYLDSLIGPYPERRDLYESRSPINFTENLTCPIIFFQGLRDEVVPPNQAEMMVNALRDKRLRVAHLTFPDEGHGFRAAATIKQTLESELVFYGRIFGFEPAGALPALDIFGL
ncbi:MAG: prolyl oligopeptidase family serine peptidase [Pseudomonadota bacterium]